MGQWTKLKLFFTSKNQLLEFKMSLQMFSHLSGKETLVGFLAYTDR